MRFDFSDVNLQYLLQARNLAIHHPDLVVPLLNIPEELASQLAGSSIREITHIAHSRYPLVIPHQQHCLWSRLFEAPHTGREEEIDAILEHTLSLLPCSESREV